MNPELPIVEPVSPPEASGLAATPTGSGVGTPTPASAEAVAESEGAVETAASGPVVDSSTVGSGLAGDRPPSVTLDELSQEIRRVGRELFKANRATERNQELFETALSELGGLGARIGDVLARGDDAALEAKAPLCRELLEVADVLEASLTAAREVLARLQDMASRPAQGIAYRLAATRELRETLIESAELMRQWYEGQALLDQRLSLALRSAGLRRVETVGRAFDPALHRVVGTESRPGVPAGTILEEERKGYLLDGRVLRYAEVTVARDE